MPVPMASSFAECSTKDIVKQQLCEETSYSECLEQNPFSFTQLLMNGDAWPGIAADAELTSTLPSVLPESDFTINPSSGGDCVSHMPPSTKDKSKKRKGPSKDLSCITATPPTKAVEVDEKQSKRHKASERIKEEQLRADQSRSEERLKGDQSHSENTENTTSKLGKDNSKPKQDFIHVRARRGQATDSHSLAERVRREKISQRMKLLQDLVPGCNKVTGKAMMLDEIINYVQSLQRQVEFLSMKLAAVKPRLNLYTDTYEVPSLAGSQDANGLNELHHEPQHALTGWQTTSDGQMMASVELQCS